MQQLNFFYTNIRKYENLHKLIDFKCHRDHTKMGNYDDHIQPYIINYIIR